MSLNRLQSLFSELCIFDIVFSKVPICSKYSLISNSTMVISSLAASSLTLSVCEVFSFSCCCLLLASFLPDNSDCVKLKSGWVLFTLIFAQPPQRLSSNLDELETLDYMVTQTLHPSDFSKHTTFLPKALLAWVFWVPQTSNHSISNFCLMPGSSPASLLFWFHERSLGNTKQKKHFCSWMEHGHFLATIVSSSILTEVARLLIC